MLAVERREHNSHGFTLIELLVTLSVVGILAAVGLPAMGQMTEQQRVKDLVFKLADDMQSARSQAITNNAARVLTVTPQSGGTAWSYTCATCSPAISASGTDYSNITLSATNTPITFNTTGNATGNVSSNTTNVTLTSSNWTVTATVTPLGKVHVCANALGLGYPKCV